MRDESNHLRFSVMYRAIPVGSKLLQRKWDQKEREMHLSKLREAKPSVDVREPTQFRHIKKKLKKNQILEGKRNECDCVQTDTPRSRERTEFYSRR